MRIMILGSEDGQDYARAVIPPENLNEHASDLIASAIIGQAIDANPNEYTWDEIAAKLTEAGFVVPEATFIGPRWDCRP